MSDLSHFLISFFVFCFVHEQSLSQNAITILSLNTTIKSSLKSATWKHHLSATIFMYIV